MTTLATRKLVVPLRRTIVVGDDGKDIQGLKRAMRQAGVGSPSKHPRIFEKVDAKFLKNFQRAHSLTVSGDYTPGTHNAMLPFYDQYSAKLMMDFHPDPAEVLRNKLYSTAVFAYQHAPRHYNNKDATLRVEGWAYRIRPPKMWHYADCSGFCLWCCWVNGIGTNVVGPYNGWTGSMRLHGRVVTLAAALKGDMVFYGSPPDYHHVAIYVGNNRVISHGQEGGPFLLPIDYRTDRMAIRNYVKL
jgi:hypothetical protein